MLNAQGWYCGGAPVPMTGCKTVPELERQADRMGYVAVRYEVDGGGEVLRRIAGQWVCTTTF